MRYTMISLVFLSACRVFIAQNKAEMEAYSSLEKQGVRADKISCTEEKEVNGYVPCQIWLAGTVHFIECRGEWGEHGCRERKDFR